MYSQELNPLGEIIGVTSSITGRVRSRVKGDNLITLLFSSLCVHTTFNRNVQLS